jgi:hypothetical protein
MASTQSTVTLQNIVDIAQTFPDLEPVLHVGGYSLGPALSAANDTMNAICGVAFPHKWAEILLPLFYTNSYQQDYAVVYPNGQSVTTLSWLERGTVFDINNAAIPKPFRQVEVGRQLPQVSGTFWNSATNSPLFLVNFFPNYILYYGTWGAANSGTSTTGNNPIAGSAYTSPLGQNISMPPNPITQIQDANGNLLLLTGYGNEGSAAPLAAPNATAGTTVSGTGATTVWTVVDPNGVGFRIMPVPSQTGVVWQFNLVGQAKPVRFTSLNQTLAPLPDEFEPNFRSGFIAQCYRYSPEAKIREKFKTEWALWLASLNELRAKEDRELEENMFTPERGIMGSRQGRSKWIGGAWPFQYPLR